jgi:hypothetical protein
LGIYFFSIFPKFLRLDSYQYTTLFLVYLVILINNLNINEFFNSKIVVKSFSNLVFLLYVVVLLISIFIFNIKDLFVFEGFSKVFLIIVSILVSGYILPKVLVNNKYLITKIIKLIFYIGLISALFGLFTFFYNIDPKYGVRLTISFFTHMNNPPFLYTFSIPCGLYLLFYRKESISIFEKYLIIPAVVLMAFNVFFTYSRAGILAMFVVIAVFTFFYSKKIFTLVVFSLIPSASVIFSNFFVVKGAASAFSRASLLVAALDLFRSSNTGFLFGFGAYYARKDYKIVMNSLNIIQEVDFPHNFIIFYIMQFGLISFIFLALFVIGVVYKSFTNIIKYKNSFYSNLLILALSITLGNFAQGLLEDLILFPQYFVFHLALVFFGILIIINSKMKHINENQANLNIIL